MTSLPHSPEVESALIAKLLVNPSDIPGLVGRIESSDFHDETMGAAWAVMAENAGDARRVDANTLAARGVQLGDPLEFINRATSAPVTEYADIIRRDARKRAALMAMRRAERAIRDAKDESGVMTAVQEAVTSVLSNNRGGTLRALGDLVGGFVPGRGGVSWGLSALDRTIQPARPSDLIIVAARPNVGKSALSMQMALSMAEGSELPVMFTTLEMSGDQFLERMSSRVGGLQQFREGYNLYIHDEPRATTVHVRANLARLRAVYGGVKACFVDYLQLLKDPGEVQHERVGRISGELKAIAREFELPMIAMSQLNRLSEIENRRPKLSDLAQSGAIEQDADIILFPHRPKKDSHMELGVAKNRHGPVGAWLDLHFDTSTVSVEDK